MDDGMPVSAEGLLRQLALIAQTVDPVPPELHQVGYDAFGLHRIDEELLALVADSQRELALVRSEVPAIRLLSFAATGMTVEVQISNDEVHRTILGQLGGSAPSGAVVVVVETPDGSAIRVAVDADLQFELQSVPAGLIRLRVERPDQVATATTWFEV